MLGIWVDVGTAQDPPALETWMPDANLRTVVLARLKLYMVLQPGDTTFTQGNLEDSRFTSLHANDKGITDITGLEYATSLTSLQLRDNSISDFTPISSLTNLKTLNLINTGFSDSDISILSPLVNLQFALLLDANRISDLQALVNVISANMPRLTQLHISDNRFCDITPLTALPTALKDQLTGLNLDNIPISNFGPLAEFTNLMDLSIERTGIKDLRPLRGLTSLTSLNLSSNGISNLEPLSGLTDLRALFLLRNQIRDLRPLSGLTKLTLLYACWNPFPTDPNPFESLTGLTAMADFAVDTTYETLAEEVFSTVPFKVFCNPANASFEVLFCSTLSETETALNPDSEVNWEVNSSEVKRRRRIITRCGLGWAPHAQYQHGEPPKVMIYALEFEYNPARNAGFSCKAIEIRTGDDSIENLAGWNLYLGTLYNPSDIPVTIPEAHSQITGRILRLTPEMLGLETFRCSTASGISHPLPSVHYVLKTDENVLVDTAYSCFIWGQNAYTTVNGVNVKSPRSISSAALREMGTPRIERYIMKPTSVYITYMNLDEFTWDRPVLSDWLLPASESSAPGAPSAIQRNLVTMWGTLKKE